MNLLKADFMLPYNANVDNTPSLADKPFKSSNIYTGHRPKEKTQ